MSYCYKCGKEIVDESIFCSYCGAKQQISEERNVGENTQNENNRFEGAEFDPAGSNYYNPFEEFENKRAIRGKDPVCGKISLVILIVIMCIGFVAGLTGDMATVIRVSLYTRIFEIVAVILAIISMCLKERKTPAIATIVIYVASLLYVALNQSI